MQKSHWKSKLLLTGTLAGAIIGFATTYLMAKNAEKEGGELNLTAGDMLKATPALLAVVRSLSSLGSG